MTKHIVFVLCSVFCILTFTACDQLMQKFVNTPDLTASLPTTAEQTPTMEVISQTFSDDYKTLVVTTKMLNDVPAYRLEDSIMRLLNLEAKVMNGPTDLSTSI